MKGPQRHSKTPSTTGESGADQLRFLSENLAHGMVYQINSGPYGIDRVFTYLSPAVERLHELTPAEVLANPSRLYNQVIPAHRELVARMEQHAYETRTRMEVEVLIQLPSGALRWRRFISAPRESDSGDIIWDGIELDVTDQHRADEEREKLQTQLRQSQKMECVGRLAGGVAHDFNNMLSVILGSCDLILCNNLDADTVLRNVEQIKQAALRSTELARQLMGFARRSGDSRVPLDLNQTISGMIAMLTRLLGENIALHWRPGTDVWRVEIDPTHVDQILVNLCINARDAISNTGQIIIQTENLTADIYVNRSIPVLEAGDYVVLSVSDTGHGMSRDTLEHVFEPFFTTKPEGKGTGLGLTMVYNLVEQAHGKIQIFSTEGVGTTFRVYFPRCPGDTPAPRIIEPASLPNARNEYVLLVEDEPAILEVAREMLRSLGYQVVTALSPTLALNLSQEDLDRIDLLITDIIMPEMNGWELARTLREKNPTLPCLFISGYPHEVVTRECVSGPLNHFVQKPFSLFDLATRVRAALADRSQP